MRGGNVSLGYAQRREDLSLGDMRRGVLHTGDLARRDAEGYYYIEGRQKRFVKMYGIRVSLDACEEILRERHPGLAIACDGRDDCLKIYVGRDSLSAFMESGQYPENPPKKSKCNLKKIRSNSKAGGIKILRDTAIV